MASIPATAGRVPTRLANEATLNRLTSTNLELLNLQEQMASAKRVLRPSDDAVAAAGISFLDRTIETEQQLASNINRSIGVMNTIDSSLGEITDIINQANALALEQVGITSDATTRAQQSTVVSAMIDQLFSTVNREFDGISLFSGSLTGVTAVEAFGSGYRYSGDQDGLRADLGPEIDFPITIPADVAIGSTSARQRGTVDLDPNLNNDTPISALRGPAAGQALGTMSANVTPPGVDVQIDLTGSQTVGDIRDAIASAIEQAAPGSLAGGFAGGVGINAEGNRLQINAAPGVSLNFDNGPVGQTASALGLQGFTFDTVNTVNTAAAADLNPSLTAETTLNQLDLAAPLTPGEQLQIRNGPTSATLTIDPNWTIDELREEVSKLNLGVRVEIDESANAINFVNEVAGYRMSIGEVSGSAAATKLGVRTMQADTRISTFNDGRGVEIADGAVDPTTGLADPTRNVDFRVTLSDGFNFDVDLVPSDMDSVQTVIDAVNNAALAAGLTIGTGAGQFQARLTADGNGIEFSDNRGGGGVLDVTQLNGFAAEDLGLLDPTNAAAGIRTGSDRSDVRVDSLFSTLLELSTALDTDDTQGITSAGERLSEDLDRLIGSRALVGGRTQRVEDAQDRLDSRQILNEQMRADLQELDYFAATTRYSALETQLQASLSVTSRLASLSLINFL